MNFKEGLSWLSITVPVEEACHGAKSLACTRLILTSTPLHVMPCKIILPRIPSRHVVLHCIAFRHITSQRIASHCISWNRMTKLGDTNV